MSKHGLEGVCVVWWFMLIFTICRVYASKWLRRVLFFTFLGLFELKVKKGSLAHDKTWFGRRLCCLVLDANLHNLPCICIKIAPTETVSLFLWVLELKMKKEAWNMAKHGLEGVSVVWWFMLILSNLHNLPCICIKMSPTGTFFTFF